MKLEVFDPAMCCSTGVRGPAVDPAADPEWLKSKGIHIPGLTISRIDPAIETRSYTEEVLRESGKDLDEKGRALLEEDLRSPGTEEIAVFRALPGWWTGEIMDLW